jgi:hypothetical protein
MDEDVKINFNMEYTAVGKEVEIRTLEQQNSAKQQDESGATTTVFVHPLDSYAQKQAEAWRAQRLAEARGSAECGIEEGAKASEGAAVVNDTTEPAPAVGCGVENTNEDVTLVKEAAAVSEASEPATGCVGDGNEESATVEVWVDTKDDDAGGDVSVGSSEVASPTTEDIFVTENIDVGDQSAHVVQEATEPGVEIGNEEGVKASEEAAVVSNTTEPAPAVESGVEDANEDVTLVEEAAAVNEATEPATVCVGDGNEESATVEVGDDGAGGDVSVGSSEVASPTTEDIFVTENIDVGDQSAHVVQEATEPGGMVQSRFGEEEARPPMMAVCEKGIDIQGSVSPIVVVCCQIFSERNRSYFKNQIPLVVSCSSLSERNRSYYKRATGKSGGTTSVVSWMGRGDC